MSIMKNFGLLVPPKTMICFINLKNKTQKIAERRHETRPLLRCWRCLHGVLALALSVGLWVTPPVVTDCLWRVLIQRGIFFNSSICGISVATLLPEWKFASTMFSFSICAEPLDLHYIPVKIVDYWTFDLFHKLFMEIIICFAHGNMKIDLHIIRFETNPFN